MLFAWYVKEEDFPGRVQLLSAIFLQVVANIVSEIRCWAHSIESDGGTNLGEPYVDMRARFCSGENLENVHLLS